MLVVDKDAIDRLNRVDEAITVATLPAFKPVVAGEMIATVKIIPFAVAEARARPGRWRRQGQPVIRVAPYKVRKVGVVSTLLPGLASKGDRQDAQDHRRAACACRRDDRRRATRAARAGRAGQAIDEVLKHGAELVVVFGASAIADRRDVIPAALEAVGGEIEHFGMPVDPGNLLLIGRRAGSRCWARPAARARPKENGFDWVLMRLLAGLPVSREDITGMGVGGLLMEIVTRPQPRDEPQPEKGRRVAAVVLAAGRSTRMGATNKLLAEIGGRPLVRIAAEQALASRARPVIVVTGHQRERVEAALEGLPVRIVHNPDYRRGPRHLAQDRHRRRADGVPTAPSSVSATCRRCRRALIDQLIAAFDPERGTLIVVPTIDGRRGNPVVWSRRFFHDLMQIQGDIGARHLIGTYAEAVAEVPVADDAALTDVDTPESLSAVKAEIERA